MDTIKQGTYILDFGPATIVVVVGRHNASVSYRAGSGCSTERTSCDPAYARKYIREVTAMGAKVVEERTAAQRRAAS